MVQKTPLSALAPVIVIDDDEFFRVAMDAVLGEWFGTDAVVTCATAAEAVEQLSGGTDFGLGLVDLNMPGIDNRDLLTTLKSARPEIRLVVLSASRSREDILMALSAGAHGFISKGLGIGEAEAAIRQIAAGAVYVPPFTPQSVGTAGSADIGGKPPSAALDTLTPRQMEVLRLLVAGQPNKGIARALGINPSTVKFHLSFIFQTLGVSNRVEAATMGARLIRDED
jgi:DNA-binding NarL/FixJ family response regulator